MSFTEPNRYAPREDWEQKLINMGPAVNSWQFDLMSYWQKRKTQHHSLLTAWTEVKMSPENARKSLLKIHPTPTNDAGLIPPEIFSRVLARSRAQAADPNDDTEVVLEAPQPVTVD